MNVEASVLDRLGLATGLALLIKATLVLATGAAAARLRSGTSSGCSQ